MTISVPIFLKVSEQRLLSAKHKVSEEKNLGMTKETNLSKLLDRLASTRKASDDELKYLLALDAPEDLARLFEAARNVRKRHFDNRVFLYGFLYFSTYCRNNCNFCQYRNDNTSISRYRKNETEILAAAQEMVQAGVHLIDLTMGEDPELYYSGELGFKRLVRLAASVKKETNLPVMISPGSLPGGVISNLGQCGVDWYACYQETHNRQLYQRLRTGQDYGDRMEKKLLAKNEGMLIEEGILVGVGESLDDIVQSIRAMEKLDADQVRVMSFVPQPGTPMGAKYKTPQGSLGELVTIAVMRLVLQDRLIPASLDVDGLAGLKTRLDAGANVVTSIVPPGKGLAGVANHSLDIEEERRTKQSILPILKSCNLMVADTLEYSAWIQSRRLRKDSFSRESTR